MAKNSDQSKKPPYEGTAAEAAKRLGLNRNTFFRFLGFGEKFGDPLPCNDPLKLPAWYARMKDRGVVKHELHRKIAVACVPELAASAGLDVAPEGGTKGFAGVLERAEWRVYWLEEQAVKHEEDGNTEVAAAFRAQHDEFLEIYRKLAKDGPEIIAGEHDQTKISWVIEDLGEFLPNITTSLGTMGERIYPRIQSALPLHVFLAIYRSEVRETFQTLRASKFAAPVCGKIDATLGE